MADISLTKRQKIKRQVRVWLEMGWSRRRINDGCFEFGVNPDQADEIIREIRHEQKSDMSIERAEFLAQQMARLEELALKAQDEGNLGVALGCFKELNALARLHAS
jgi:hypothetical protein